MLHTAPEELVTSVGIHYYTIYEDTYKDCVHAQTSGVNFSSVLRVRTPLTNTTIEVYCDMDTHGGGWLVFQNRFDDSINFHRNFTDYEEGFGDVRSEYWLGLKYLYEFTAYVPSMVYLKFVDANDSAVFELFDGFSLMSGPGYGYNIGTFLDATDGTLPPDYSQSFGSTKRVGFSAEDIDRDKDPDIDCAKLHQAGWWFRSCTSLNLNGPYLKPGTKFIGRDAFLHKSWKTFEPLKASRLMIRRPSNDKN